MANKKIKQTKNKAIKQQTLAQAVKEQTDKIPVNIKYIIFWIVGLLVLFLILNSLFPAIYKLIGVGTVSYEGLTFTKEDIGQSPNVIPIYHYYYLYKDVKGEVVQNNIYLRNDPSKNDIEVNGQIIFFENMPVQIGIDTDNLVRCNQSNIALSELTAFIKNAGHLVSGGTINKSEAMLKNVSYVDCGTKNNSMTLRFILGNSSYIERKNSCYTISAGTCEQVLPSAEKFIVQSIVDAKKNN